MMKGIFVFYVTNLTFQKISLSSVNVASSVVYLLFYSFLPGAVQHLLTGPFYKCNK